jgi:hypothetical protein
VLRLLVVAFATFGMAGATAGVAQADPPITAATNGYWRSLSRPEQEALVDWIVRMEGTPTLDGGWINLPYTDSYPEAASAAIQTMLDSMSTGDSWSVVDANGTTETVPSSALGWAEDDVIHSAGLWAELPTGYLDHAAQVSEFGESVIPSMDFLPEAFELDSPWGALAAGVVQLAPTIYQLIVDPTVTKPLAVTDPFTNLHFCLNTQAQTWDPICAAPTYGNGQNTAPYPYYDCYVNGYQIGVRAGGASEGSNVAWGNQSDCGNAAQPVTCSGVCTGGGGYWGLGASGVAVPTYILNWEDNGDPSCTYGKTVSGLGCWWSVGYLGPACPESGQLGEFFDTNGDATNGTVGPLPGMGRVYEGSSQCWVPDPSSLSGDQLQPGAGIVIYTPKQKDWRVGSGISSDPCPLEGITPGRVCGIGSGAEGSVASTVWTTPATQTIEQGLQQTLDSPAPGGLPELGLLEWSLGQVWGEPEVCDDGWCVTTPSPGGGGADVEIPAPMPNELTVHYEARLDTLGLTNQLTDTATDAGYDPFQDADTVVGVQPAAGTEVDPTTDPQVTVTQNPDEQQPQTPVSGGPYTPGSPGPIKFPNLSTPCNVFPFGVPCWIVAQLQQFDAAPAAPEFSIYTGPLGGTMTIDLGNVFGYDTSVMMVYARWILLFLSVGGFILWLANRPAEGFSTNDAGEQGSLM